MVEGFSSKRHRHLPGGQLRLQLAQLLLQNQRGHLPVHIVEHNGTRQTVQELGLEGALHLFHHRLATADAAVKANGLRRKLRSGIRGHDEHHVAEVGLAPLVVRQPGIIHHLQQNVVYVLMGLFYLVEQQHGIGGLTDGIGQQAAVLVAHIAGRRANELGHGMLLGIFAHVEAYQLDAQLTGQHLGHLRLAHTRGTHEEQRGQRLVVVEQSGTRHLHGFHYLADGLVLTVYLRKHSGGQRLQLLVVIGIGYSQGIHLTRLGQHVGDVGLGDCYGS